MKRALVVGLIAGFASGIVKFIFASFNTTIGWLPIPISIHAFALSEIIQGIVWGIIFGAFYAFFYDHIPAKGIRKGLYYGLIIWIIAIFRPTIIGIAHGSYLWAISHAWIGFFSVWITYGLTLGYLYKK